ncbi:50S ribosomal protein L3 [Candidatus Jidaibacter acanthamoeba]|jgi:large subunit ribosomal protein L3|uniref:Large ribosomal subunit protein uL3 n=1 Tax=Candidatus Jidaibacter acanthamoebae TaxID=86105 RepID=A0A0C1QP33_9RICK|nr:50S ribosomal protein L3 [Candidatus Jidaibacter acanthamoeba]KIE05823.1 50S ribosomal protein L3 [Candidatus Jidaibacter acanthamoeba]
METVRRTGLIATKIGMTQIFDATGEAIPVTLMHVDSNFVLGNKEKNKDGYDAVILGYGKAKPNRVSKPVKGQCSKVKVEPVKHIREFRVSGGAQLEVGKQVIVSHFVLGQLVDVKGTSIGKGFAGAMKRHNFGGLEASHGVSVSHRSHGSTGQRQDPGKVFKNKKMAGHLGDERVTIQNLEIIDINSEMNIIALRGAVPGNKGSIVYIVDAIKKAVPVSANFPAAYAESN